MTAVGSRGDAKPTVIKTASFWSTTSQPTRVDVVISGIPSDAFHGMYLLIP